MINSAKVALINYIISFINDYMNFVVLKLL